MPWWCRGVRFLGASLWTDFALFGEDKRWDAIRVAGDGMNDYQRIKITQQSTPGIAKASARTKKLLPGDTRARFTTSLAFLTAELSQPFEGKTVVVTHRLPHRDSLAAMYQTDPISAAYASDLSTLIETAQPALWLHGHTDDSADYRISATRVVCNPRGYLDRGGADENRSFDPALLIAV